MYLCRDKKKTVAIVCSALVFGSKDCQVWFLGGFHVFTENSIFQCFEKMKRILYTF